MSFLLGPSTREDEIALFRAMVIGDLARQEIGYGQLRKELKRLSRRRFRPPGSKISRAYSRATLERWLYAYRHGGFKALRPRQRNDKGRARALTAEHRDLLLAIRREHPSASVPLILSTLAIDGVLPEGVVSPQSVRRLFRRAGLCRQTRKDRNGDLEQPRQRLRWVASSICRLWQADVCHAFRLPLGNGRTTPALVHAVLDDHSRYIVRLEVRGTETEQDMLEILAAAVRENGVAPDALYADNGATYSGGMLPLACERLGTHLTHSRPGDSSSRGKIERLFRTMREQCIDHLHDVGSLHDVYVRLLAWRERYHCTAHTGLLGRKPGELWRQGVNSSEYQNRRQIDEDELQQAFRVTATRKILKDSTLSIDGRRYEVDAGWLAGKTVKLVYSLLGSMEPYVLLEEKRYILTPVDPYANARRRRRPPKQPELPFCETGFAPTETALMNMLKGKSQEDA